MTKQFSELLVSFKLQDNFKLEKTTNMEAKFGMICSYILHPLVGEDKMY